MTPSASSSTIWLPLLTKTFHGRQLGSVPSTTDLQTGFPSASATTSRALLILVIDRSFIYVLATAVSELE